MLRNKALLLAGKIKITWGKILANLVSCLNVVYMHDERKEERERERERNRKRERDNFAIFYTGYLLSIGP